VYLDAAHQQHELHAEAIGLARRVHHEELPVTAERSAHLQRHEAESIAGVAVVHSDGEGGACSRLLLKPCDQIVHFAGPSHAQHLPSPPQRVLEADIADLHLRVAFIVSCDTAEQQHKQHHMT
jgi:hypothetical protein